MAPATTQTAVTVELSEEARERVAWFMDRTLQSLSALAGQKVKLLCGHSITRKVLKELPDATLSWIFNTEPLVMDPSRVFYYKDNLDITDLIPRDSGVYACVVTWGTDDTVKQNLTLGVFSLEVETEGASRYVFEHDPTEMDCHSVTLGEIFPDAIRYWLFNGTHTNVLPVTKASNRTTDIIRAANKSMSGVWECQVLQQRTARVWASAWYNLSVQDAPTSADRAFRHIQENWYTVVVVLSIVSVLVLLLFCLAANKLKKIQDDVDERFRDQREGWEETLIKHGVDGKIDLNRLTPPPSPTQSQTEDDNADIRNIYGAETLHLHRNTGSKVSDGDGGDGDKKSEGSTERKSDTASVNAGEDWTWNNAHALYECSKTSTGIKYKEIGKRKAHMTGGFVDKSNENKSLNNTESTLKQALTFGRNLLAKHKDINLPAVTSNDALSWLNRHSRMAKRKSWGSYLKKHVPSHLDSSETFFDEKRKSGFIGEEQHDLPTKRMSDDFCQLPLHEYERSDYPEKISVMDPQEDMGQGISSNRSKSRKNPLDASVSRTSSELRPRGRHGHRPKSLILARPTPKAQLSTGCLKDGGDHNSIPDANRDTHHHFYKARLKVDHGETAAFGRQHHDIRVLHWKKWLRSKLSTRDGQSHTHEWSNKSFPWQNKEVLYTALPQNDEGRL